MDDKEKKDVIKVISLCAIGVILILLVPVFYNSVLP